MQVAGRVRVWQQHQLPLRQSLHNPPALALAVAVAVVRQQARRAGQC